MVQTTGMRLTKKQEAVKVPSWIRVQDCAIVGDLVAEPLRLPRRQGLHGHELYQARVRRLSGSPKSPGHIKR